MKQNSNERKKKMSDENIEQVEENVELIFEGTIPASDLESYLEVEAKATIKDKDGNITGYKQAKGYFRFGKDLDEAVELYGKEITFSNARAQEKIKLQSLMRSHILAGKDIGTLLATWKPGMQMERTPVDPMVAAESKFDSLSSEEQEAFINKLLARQNQ
jgi:hypothetical protein